MPDLRGTEWNNVAGKNEVRVFPMAALFGLHTTTHLLSSYCEQGYRVLDFFADFFWCPGASAAPGRAEQQWRVSHSVIPRYAALRRGIHTPHGLCESA